MTSQVVVSRIQNRRGTQAQFNAMYPPGYTGVGGATGSKILQPGEIALCTDTRRIFIGNLNGEYTEIGVGAGGGSDIDVYNQLLLAPLTINLPPSGTFIPVPGLSFTPTPFLSLLYSIVDVPGASPNDAGVAFAKNGEMKITALSSGPVLTSYSLVASSNVVYEGTSVTITLYTTNVTNGTIVPYTISGTGITSADISGASLTGNFTVSSGTASVVLNMTTDGLTEGAEILTIALDNGHSTISISVNDAAGYSISTDVSTVDETTSKTVVATVTTTNVVNGTVLYWTTSGTATSADFSDGIAEGSFIINSNSGTITRTVLEDHLTEGTEGFVINVRTASVAGPIVISSSNIIVSDTSLSALVPSYSVSPNMFVYNEGASIPFVVSTANVPDGTTLYWVISGTVSAADFTDPTLSGSFVINSNLATITRVISNDVLAEGPETFTMSIRTGSIAGPEVAITGTVVINDTSTPGATYLAAPNTFTINEGDTVTITVTTTNVPNGTILFWTTSGTVSASDFVDTTLTGSVTINSNSGTIFRTLNADTITEGSETFSINIKTGSTAGPTVAVTSPAITVIDTSLTPGAPSHTVVPNTTSINEGGTVTFTFTVQNAAAAGSTYWWYAMPSVGSITTGDFTNAPYDYLNSGYLGYVGGPLVTAGTLANNTATFAVGISNDLLTEGTEQFQVIVYGPSPAHVQAAASLPISIVDTSISASTYSVVPNTTSINEGSTVTFTITTTNVSNGTILYWTTNTISGSVTASDFGDTSLTGSVTITSNSGTIPRAITADATTEGTESFSLSLRTGSSVGPVVATSSTVTINDTSLSAPTYYVASNLSSINEGATATFAVTTTLVPNGTILYWTVAGSNITTADFTDSLLSNSFVVNSNTATITRTAANDAITEGSETFVMSIRTGSVAGPVVASSSSVTIVDSSVFAVNFLIVGGGGGYGGFGGGGGGGVVRSCYGTHTYDYIVPIGVPQTVIVGAKAIGATNGGDSQFGSVIAYGGGCGATTSTGNGAAGGSGGGGSGTGLGGTGTSLQGHAGADGIPPSYGGGGGGWAAAGVMQTGGAGINDDIEHYGTYALYGAGGSVGGSGPISTAGQGEWSAGFMASRGIVVVRYPVSHSTATVSGSVTYSTDGVDRIYVWDSGSGSITF